MEPDLSHLPSFYSSLLTNLSDQSGLPCDQLNCLLLLFSHTLFGFVYQKLNNLTFRYVSGMMIGLLSMYALYGIKQTFGLLAFISIMYPISTKCRNPTLTFWISQITLFLTFGYVWYYYYLDFTLDFNTSLMGITVRLNTLTHDLYDYQLIQKHKIKDQDGNMTIKYENIFGKRKTIRNYRIKNACNPDQVTFFVYLSYMLFFVHSFSGSNLTITQFLSISDKTIYEKNGWKDAKNAPKPSWRTMFWRVTHIVITASFFVLSTLLPMELVYNLPSNMSLTKKLAIMTIWGYAQPFKLQFVWNVMDLTTLISGVAFSGVEYDENNGEIKQIHWKTAKNINSFQMLCPQHTAQMARNWNMTVSHWLTFYVFYRSHPPQCMDKILGNKEAKILITRVTAAMFHGVYIGYYIFFGLTWIMTVTIDGLRESLPTYDKLENKTSIFAYSVYLSWGIFINCVLGFIIQWFMNLDTPQVIMLMTDLHWIPVSFPFILLIVVQILKLFVRLQSYKPIKHE